MKIYTHTNTDYCQEPHIYIQFMLLKHPHSQYTICEFWICACAKVVVVFRNLLEIRVQ